MKKIILLSLLVLIVALVLTDLSCVGGYSGGEENIAIGATPIELNALIYVAHERGFFSNNGIRTEFKNYDTGAAAVDGMINGEVDISLTFESVLISHIFQKNDVVDLATIDKSNLFFIISRTDRGIMTLSDLRGKRIGIPLHTIHEFYLGRTLELNGISIHEVTLVDMNPSDSFKAIAEGDLDAIIIFEPHVTEIREEMGNQVKIWSAQNGQTGYWSVVSSSTWINDHNELAERFLRSLIRAEEYTISHEQEVKALLKSLLKYDDSYIEAFWPQNQYNVSLDQSLVVAMEDEFRWMKESNVTNETQMPDFISYIHEDVLKAIRPEAVNIIR